MAHFDLPGDGATGDATGKAEVRRAEGIGEEEDFTLSGPG